MSWMDDAILDLEGSPNDKPGVNSSWADDDCEEFLIECKVEEEKEKKRFDTLYIPFMKEFYSVASGIDARSLGLALQLLVDGITVRIGKNFEREMVAASIQYCLIKFFQIHKANANEMRKVFTMLVHTYFVDAHGNRRVYGNVDYLSKYPKIVRIRKDKLETLLPDMERICIGKMKKGGILNPKIPEIYHTIKHFGDSLK